ncbi:MAG TPA: aldehyde dehydrogenase family protein [Candidatus Marinimicrobia bacterium]|nr:aldehyde dehydrogenase family protein [Candidatus Neomarinimicrobiota bacterium]
MEIISINPATKETIGSVQTTSLEFIETVFDRAKEGAAEWANLRLTQRSRKIRLVRKMLVAHMDELSKLIAAETGKTNWDGFLEVFTTVEHMRHVSKHGPQYLRTEIRSPGILQNKKCYVNYVPHGVAGVISPWNYPLILTAAPVIEALMAGNAVVLKPSELTPLTGKLMTELFHEAGIPENVLQTVYGYGEIGAAIVDSPKTDMICFTGSVEVGRKIAVACAEKLKPVILELGGKDPMIILEDANLQRAAGAAVWGGFSNCGQTCISTERVYVVEKIADEFIELVKTKTEALYTGPDKVDGEIGALVSESQHEIVMAHINQAVESGADVVSGGESLSALGGYFIKPTVLEVQVDNTDIMQKETFGPEICIMRVKDEVDAVEKANSSGYGLSASVFTKNKKRGQKIARQIRAGSVCVNDVITNYITADLPFGGVGISGIGRVHGAEGLKSFCQTQAVLVDRFGLKKEPWWYPVNKKLQSFFRVFTRVFYG